MKKIGMNSDIEIEHRTVKDYPVRYFAFDCPCVLFVAQDTELGSSKNKELAAYYEPMQNTDNPTIRDGMYAQVHNMYGKEYLAEIHATQPWKKGAQKADYLLFSDFIQAVAWIEEQIPIYRRFCAYRVEQ